MFEIGSSLREARLHKGVEIPDAERATKIRAKYLRALETESFDVLPGQAYIKSFLRTYADYLDLDGQLFVDEYTSRFWIDEEPGTTRSRRIRVRERHHKRAERRMVTLTVLGIGLVTALVIAAWNYGGGGATPESIPNLTPVTQPRAHPTQAVFVARAVGGASLLEVRKDGVSGRVLFQGTLEKGEKQRFVAKRLWLNIGSPENLEVTLGGRPATLGAGCPQVVTVTRSQLTSTSSCN
ncbi:MAG TPA: RodZ domain-containing protein [Gaiellaceae bacterium]|nr:RodZ domain-containing protein [Gaiellaceae bacterium]